MQEKKIDFDKLLGFDTVSDRIEGRFDFRDETIGTKLGAKVGGEPDFPKKIDFGKLLGFDTVGNQISEGLDFQDETIGTKLGARVGPEQSPDGSADLAEAIAKPR